MALRYTPATQGEYNRSLPVLHSKGNTMRVIFGSALAVTIVLIASSVAIRAQAPPAETSRAVAGGGIINAPGWTGKVDPTPENLTLDSAKFALEGKIMKVMTGPAVTYWNPANKASGDYTVKATFTEPKYMNLNSHPHPYGIMIAGNDLGTANQSLLYCAPYGNGTFIVRGFGPDAFQMNGRTGAANAAVHKAAGVGQPVTQDVALSVKGGRVECSVNGTVVAGYDKAEVVTAGKLKSTDGVYGLRFAHNTEVEVTGFAMTKN
jgi:hypothetical protein